MDHQRAPHQTKVVLHDDGVSVVEGWLQAVPLLKSRSSCGIYRSRNSVEPHNSREPGRGPARDSYFFLWRPEFPKGWQETPDRDAHKSAGKKRAKWPSPPGPLVHVYL